MSLALQLHPPLSQAGLIMGSFYQVASMRSPSPMFIKVWFAIDLVLALFPPVHWAMSGSEPILGIPEPLLYLYGTSSIIAASIVAAYFADRARRSSGAGVR
jgi:hypothetical protein